MKDGNARMVICLAHALGGFESNAFTVIPQSGGPALIFFPHLIRLIDPNVAS